MHSVILAVMIATRATELAASSGTAQAIQSTKEGLGRSRGPGGGGGVAAISGPVVLDPPPTSVDKCTPISCAAAGASGPSQMGFDEQQGVTLGVGIATDDGVIPAGTVVDSHMIFLNTCGVLATGVETWCFDGPVIGVMSDEDGLLEAASTGVLGHPAVCYPPAFPFRGLDAVTGDSYTVRGCTIEVDTSVTTVGDWIRVVTAASGTEGAVFSLSGASPSIGTPDHWTGNPIGAGDFLTIPNGGYRVPNPPMVGAAPPGVLMSELSLHLVAPPGGVIEVDAISFGHDQGDTVVFSVAEGSIGCPGAPAPCTGPSAVWLEGYCPCVPVGPVCAGAPGDCSAASDVFSVAPAGGNTLMHEELQFGLINASGIPGLGQDDDIDALDLDATSADLCGRIYLSLDSATAAANGFSGADILVFNPCVDGAPTVYAAAAQLLLAPADDLDALALNDDGDGVFEPGVDVVRFSIRAGSPTVGDIECTGMPPFTAHITPGDILRPGGCGGGGAVRPKIVFSSQSLGLFVNPFDELDALDIIDASTPECYADCDTSGTLSIDDYICFQTYFAIGDPYADCDGSGTNNVDDFICFQTLFAVGC
jgi:hypothetical protein